MLDRPRSEPAEPQTPGKGRVAVVGGIVGFLTASAVGAPDVQGARGGAEAEFDPYTRGTSEAIAAAGYRSLGPFLFGDRATTDGVQETLGDVPLCWIETEHFRLGVCLDELRIPGDELHKVRGELARLSERLPRVKRKAKVLDPWLRAHLMAQRLEDLHRDFTTLLLDSGDGKGGPGLSMKDAFTVLIVQKESSLARFTGEYCGREVTGSKNHHFHEAGTLFFGQSDQSIGHSDKELHAAVAFGVALNLANAIDGFPHALPVWWQSGLATWLARRAVPGVHVYQTEAHDALPSEGLEDWEALVRGRVENDFVTDWETMLGWSSVDEIRFGDRVVLWSRIDYLLDLGEDVRHTLLSGLHARGSRESSSEVLRRATGLGLPELDLQWRAFVSRRYRPKRR